MTHKTEKFQFAANRRTHSSYSTTHTETIVGAAIMYMDAIKIDSTSQRP